MTGSPPISRVSLAVAALDIGRVLADRDGVTFRAQGTCMYPAVRPGDVLRIRSCPASEVAVGDIAVCRRPDCLFGHRVVATGVSDGRPYVITRPDRSIQGEDAPTYDEDLLGVVVEIRRRGASVPLEPKAAPRLRHWYHRARLALIETAGSGRRRLVGHAARIQDQPAYRSLASRRFGRLRPRLRFTVRVPVVPTLGEAVYRELEVGDFIAQPTWHGRPVERWTLTAHVDSSREPAAWVTFAHDGAAQWRAVEAYVRARFRGTGLDDDLIEQAHRILEGTEGNGHAG